MLTNSRIAKTYVVHERRVRSLYQGAFVSQVPPLRPLDLFVVTSGRLASTTAFRIVYPLLPFLSTRFEVSLQQVATLVALQTAASLASPIGGTLADRFGERKVMLGGLSTFIVGALLCSFTTVFWLFQLGYLLIGLATALYLPSAQSYLSARSPYEQRGRMLGIFETAWAISAIVGVAPLMYLIDMQDNISWAYAILAGVGAFGLMSVYQLPEHHARQSTSSPTSGMSWETLKMPTLWLLLLFPFLTLGGNDLFFVTQSTWLKDVLNADESMLGNLFVLIGIAELAGSLAVVAFSDRIGKRRSVLASFTITSICLLLMPIFDSSWISTVIVLFIFYFMIEYAIVASFPLLSEALPQARGTMMAMVSATIGFGRIFSSLGSEWLYTTGQMTLVTAVAAGASMLGLLALSRSSLTPKR
ncbi:MAG: MFS transporter [Chloroflexi bacterium]|nr:MFS transporter [Chloroflexota bacterium]